jgi:PAS domain S-box-containing protein
MAISLDATEKPPGCWEASAPVTTAGKKPHGSGPGESAMSNGKPSPARATRRTLWLALLPALLLIHSLNPAARAENSRRVLVLYPTSEGQPGTIAFDQGLRFTLRTSSTEQIEVHNEYLDTVRFPDDQYQRQLAEFLRRKYASLKIDVIIVGLAPSLDFLLKNRDEFFPEVPVVFGAIEQREVKARKLGLGVVGVPMKVDLAPTLELALRLHPNTRRVIVVAGRAKTDTYWEAEARRAFGAYEDKLELVYLTGLPMNDLLKTVADLSEGDIVYYLNVMRDGTGNVYTPAEVAGQVSAAANAPVYGHFETYLGRGIVGGQIVSFEAEGQKAAQLALRIFAGEKPESMPLAEASESPFMFDWRQLQRWGISEESLPPGSIVRYKQPGFWDLYRWQILGVVSLCIVEALLIFGLLLQKNYRRRAEERFRHAVEAAPSGMIMVGQNGQIVLANAQMVRLFGYQKEELLGETVEMLVPERFREQHPLPRNQFFAAPANRPMGAGRELLARRKDGSEFPVEIGLNPIQTRMGSFVLASIIDITQRKQDEEDLRANERELRALTGRLLQAQETERRRIARELHDDLNQSLALLAVELDLLGQKPPESIVQLGGIMQELSSRVKQLSSTVHGLSHLLHPSKLEQLGLVSAVRALCKELHQAHGLTIDFAHQHVPLSIPHDTSLCLYRIAQEALRNVIKHSGAGSTHVELRGSEEEITLRIVDDGAGFEIGSLDGQSGLGLVSMRERLRLVGGTIAIDSRKSAGTRIDVRVPRCSTNQRPDEPSEQSLPAQSAGIG